MRNLFLLIALCCVAFSVRAQRLVEVGKGFSSTSVNTTVFRNNSIVTHGNTQYISYYDAEGWLMLGKRRLGTGEWILHRTQYKGHVKDAYIQKKLKKFHKVKIIQIGRASCRKECRSRWSPYH